MDLTSTSKSTSIEPCIELDGGYAYCSYCYCELKPSDNICPKCGQAQDWSWFRKGIKNE